MDTFAPEDRYALQGVRLAVEKSRLPADVLDEFREWVLVGLFVRGRDAISDYFFDVLRFEGVEDISDESNVFGSYLAHEFDRYLDSDGTRFAPRFRHRPAPAPPAPVRPVERVAPSVGPALPPALVRQLRSLGFVLSSVEDVESGLWKRDDPPPAARPSVGSEYTASTATATPRVLTPATSYSVDRRYSSDDGLGAYSVPADKLPAPVIVDGVDWGNPRVRFVGAATVAFVGAGGVPGSAGEFREKYDRGPGSRPRAGGAPPKPPVPPSIALPARIPPPLAKDRASEADVPGGGHYGLRAVVADGYYHLALDALGVDPSLANVCTWLRGENARVHPGRIDLVSSYMSTGGGPYPNRFWARRRHGASLGVPDLLGNWRGKSAPLDDGPPDVW